MDTSFNYNSILKMHDYSRTRQNVSFNLSELINMLSSQDIAELHKILKTLGKMKEICVQIIQLRNKSKMEMKLV